MVDPSILVSRLSALEGYLRRLEAFRQVPLDQFVNEPDVHHLAERYLHLACESILDTAQHIISDHGFRQPESYKDALVILRDEGILEPELAQRLQGWMGFRNVLVHLYLEIDHELSYRAIQEQLGDLAAFAQQVSRLLED